MSPSCIRVKSVTRFIRFAHPANLTVHGSHKVAQSAVNSIRRFQGRRLKPLTLSNTTFVNRLCENPVWRRAFFGGIRETADACRAVGQAV
jgi:hypothetical protein